MHLVDEVSGKKLRLRNGRLAPDERAAQVRSLRGEGLTHREIAERLDVSTSTIANMVVLLAGESRVGRQRLGGMMRW